MCKFILFGETSNNLILNIKKMTVSRTFSATLQKKKSNLFELNTIVNAVWIISSDETALGGRKLEVSIAYSLSRATL